MPSGDADALHVDRLSVTYAGRGHSTTALRDVSFSVGRGELVALVGESGSGKSTAALALTRLLPPQARVSGRVRLDGQDVLTLPPDALRRLRGGRIAYVFQDPATSLNPVLTVGEQLQEMIVQHTELRGRAAATAAADWLRQVGLAEPERRLGAYPHEFSGGMQQRVMIAMALAARPALLVADEPTTALDVTVQLTILRLLRDLQRRLGLSVLLITHDLLIVERLARRVVVLQRGAVAESGPVAEVFSRPQHPITRQLLESRPRLPGASHA